MGLRTEGVCIVSKGVNLLLTGVSSIGYMVIILAIENMSGRMKKQAVCLQMLIKTKNAKLRKAILEHADPELIRALCAQHTAWERANDAARKGATAEVSDQITTASTQEREHEAETSEAATDRWILTCVVSSIGGLCHHTIATSTFCMILILLDQTRVDQRGPEWTRGDQSGPEGTRGDQRGPEGTRGDQRGPEWTRGDQRGPEWTRGDQRGPEGTRGDQRGPEGTRGDQRGPEGTRGDQMGPERTRGDQRGPEGTRGDPGNLVINQNKRGPERTRGTGDCDG